MFDQAAGLRQKLQPINALPRRVDQPQRVPADPRDEVGFGRKHRGEVAHPRIATVLDHGLSSLDLRRVHSFGDLALSEHEVSKAAPPGIEAGMQPPVAAGAARRAYHRAVHQRQVQRRFAAGQATPLLQPPLQQMLQPVAHLAQTTEDAFVAQFDDGRFGGHRRSRAQRQMARPIHQRQTQKILRPANLAHTLQGTKRSGRGLKIGNFANTQDNRRPLAGLKRCFHSPQKSPQPEPTQDLDSRLWGRAP